MSIFDWMPDFEPQKEPKIGEWVYKRGAVISRVMRRSYIGRMVLMDYSTQSQEVYKAGILEDVIMGKMWNGHEYVECEMSIVNDGTKTRCQVNHTTGNEIFECLPWHSYEKRESGIFGQVRHPCGRRCKHEWGSRNCFEARGQIFNWHERQWVRDENGEILIGKRTCDWEPKERS